MTPALNVRTGSATDAPALARLRLAFRTEIGVVSEPATAFIERCTRWMAERLHEPATAWHCWVAESEESEESEEILGAIWLQLLEKIPNPADESELHAYVTNFYVVPAARGLGLGDQMLGIVLAWCKARNVDTVLLWPSTKSRPLYARHGFAASGDLFALRLGSRLGEPTEPR